LARVVRPLGRQIVLTGERATDSDVGVLAAALSPHLGVPAVTGARSIARDPAGAGLTVTVSTDEGWERYALQAPCIISVGEKVARPLKPTSGEGSPSGSVERIDLDRLPAERGAPTPAASRTRIVRWVRIEKARDGRIFDGASVEDGLAALRMAAHRTQGGGAADREGEPRIPVTAGALEREILVLASGPTGGLDPRSLPILSQLAGSLPGFWLSAVWVGPNPSPEVAGALAAAGATRGYGLRGPDRHVWPVVAAMALEKVLDGRPAAAAIVVPEGGFGRQTAGPLASRIDRGLITEVERVFAEVDGTLRWTKSSFGSREWVTVSALSVPAIALMRSAVPDASSTGSGLSLDWADLPFEVPSVPIQRLGTGVEVGPEFGELERAEVVVGIGMGVGGPDSIRALLPALARSGAALGASRRVVDAGWVPPQLQVGLTGRSVTPRLGILVGVFGSPNQMIGWRRTGTLVAINSDPKAPVFSQVDMGFVGRWEDLLPRVLEAVAPATRRSP
jgi:electron transfer flavoprotein alpha subunit